MKKDKKVSYSDYSIQFGERVKDFLPKPDDLVLKDSSQKVTIALEKESVEFFKKEAKRLNTSYQRMIRNLLREYTHMMLKDKLRNK